MKDPSKEKGPTIAEPSSSDIGRQTPVENNHITALVYFQQLRKTCYHESGHLAVLQYFGGVGYIRIEERENPEPHELPFAGCLHAYHLPLDGYQRKLIGLAGVAAEFLSADTDVEADEIWEEMEWATNPPLSETDSAMAGDFSEDDIAATLDLLRSIWTTVEWISGWEIVKFEEVAA